MHQSANFRTIFIKSTYSSLRWFRQLGTLLTVTLYFWRVTPLAAANDDGTLFSTWTLCINRMRKCTYYHCRSYSNSSRLQSESRWNESLVAITSYCNKPTSVMDVGLARGSVVLAHAASLVATLKKQNVAHWHGHAAVVRLVVREGAQIVLSIIGIVAAQSAYAVVSDSANPLLSLFRMNILQATYPIVGPAITSRSLTDKH